MIDSLSCIIILRALFILLLVEKGWTVKKNKKNTYQMYKDVKKK
jgi:hypothetical protein